MSRLGDRAGMGHNSEVGKLGQTTLNGRSAQRYTHIAEDRERRPIGVSTYESRFFRLERHLKDSLEGNLQAAKRCITSNQDVVIDFERRLLSIIRSE